MEKEKKSVKANLIGRSVLFSGLTAFAVVLIPFILYFIFFFGVVSISSLVDGQLDMMAAFITIASLYLSIVMIRHIMKNATKLWTHWRRKMSMDAEDKRVLRLVDNVSHQEDSESLEEKPSSEKQQIMP